MNHLKRLIILIVLLTLSMACAPKTVTLERPAHFVWKDMHNRIQTLPEDQPFLINASITYISPQDRNRLQAAVWGRLDYPVRMDLSAGFGQTVTMWYEDPFEWQAYFPGENTKYHHYDGRIGASYIGYASPFNLRTTARILLGDLRGLIPSEYYGFSRCNGCWEYSFQDSWIQSLTVSMNGELLSMSGHDWKVEFSGYTIVDQAAYYSRLEMHLPGDEKIIIRIRSVKLEELEWEPGQLELKAPPQAEHVYLPEL